MYKKRFTRKSDDVGTKSAPDLKEIEADCGILQPELQYMNNYFGQVSRMKCFSDITEPEDKENSLFSSDLDDEEEF